LEQKLRERFRDDYAIKDINDLKHYHGHISEVFPKAVTEDLNALDSRPAVRSSGLSEEASLVYIAQKKPASFRRRRDAVSAAINSLPWQRAESSQSRARLSCTAPFGGFGSKDGDRGITVWILYVQLQIAPRLEVQINFWDKDVSKSALFHSLHIAFHFNRISYDKHDKTKCGTENFKKTVTEPKRPDGSLNFYGEVSFQFEFDARFATLSGGFQAVTADPELKTHFENGESMKVYEELEALMQPASPQHIVLDLVVRNFQVDVGEDDKVPKWPADPVLIATINSLPGKTNCFAVEGEDSEGYTMPSIDEEYDFAGYRTKFGEPRCTTGELCNRAAQMDHETNPLPMVAHETEPHFCSID
jgi:hypothetical protein